MESFGSEELSVELFFRLLEFTFWAVTIKVKKTTTNVKLTFFMNFKNQYVTISVISPGFTLVVALPPMVTALFPAFRNVLKSTVCVPAVKVNDA